MGVFKLFNSPQNVEECFNKSESYPDGEIRVTFNGTGEVFKIHRIVLACKNMSFKQLFSSSSMITITKHKPSIVRKFLTFYYSGRIDWENNEIIPLLQLSNEYFAPEIVVSLLHNLYDNFTSIIQGDNIFEDVLKLLSIFNETKTSNYCKNTFIETIVDPNSFMNDMLKPVLITRQRSNVNTFTKAYVPPFKLKEKENLNFIERYGGKIWNEKFKSIKVKCLEYLQGNFEKFIKSQLFLSIVNIEDVKRIIMELSELNNFGGRGQFLPALLNWINHDYQNRFKDSSLLFNFLQDLSESCMSELTISKNKQVKKQEQEDDFKLTIELPTPPKREIIEKKEENTPEISIKKKSSISFLGIDMEEAHSASTPGSPVISLVSSPQLDELITPPSSQKSVETPSSQTTPTLSPTISSTDSGKKVGRSKSAFIRPRMEQEKGTFGHLKRLATPFAFSHSETDDPIHSNAPPKTTFEVEEETLSDWQEVGRVVSYVPVKRIEEIVIKKPQE